MFLQDHFQAVNQDLHNVLANVKLMTPVFVGNTKR